LKRNFLDLNLRN